MIIGVSGPIAAWTDSVAAILVEQGFKWFSFSDVLREEAKLRGLEINRKALQDLGDELRKTGGTGAIAKKIMEQFVEGENYVVGNIRNPGEVEELKKLNDFFLIKVDASLEIRFERIKSRNRDDDVLDFSEFKKVEERDLGIGQEEHGQRHADVFELADFEIINEGTEEDLRKEIEAILSLIKRMQHAMSRTESS